MGPTGQLQLDFEFLAGQAKAVALEVAADNQLFLAPEALPAIDGIIEERKEIIERTWHGLDNWKGHVRHICAVVAKKYKARGTKSIRDPKELIETAQPVYSVYPYD